MEQEVQSVDTSASEATHQSLPEFGSGRIRTALPIEAAIETTARVSPMKVMLVCLSAMLLPGLGHLVLGRWGRAFVLMLSILGMFAIGLFRMQGHLYLPNLDDPVSIFPFLANVGIGGVYGLCYYFHTGFEANAAIATYEFGNTFLFVAGLLNYLVILDAFDIAVGRRK
jgi:hypothetical protein